MIKDQSKQTVTVALADERTAKDIVRNFIDFEVIPHIRVNAKGRQYTYDGKVHGLAAEDVSIEGLPDGYSWRLADTAKGPSVSTTSVRDVADGKKGIVLDNLQIYCGDKLVWDGSAANAANDGVSLDAELGSLEVLPRPVALTVGTYEKSFGTADPDFAASIEGMVDGEDPQKLLNFTLTRNGVGTLEGERAGGHVISSPQADEVQGNYQLKVVPGTLTIKKAESFSLSLSGYGSEEDPKPYDRQAHSVLLDPEVNGLPLGTSLLYETSTDGGATWQQHGSAAPTFTDATWDLATGQQRPVKVRLTATNENFEQAQVVCETVVNIVPLEATVAVRQITKTYGQPDPAIAADVTGVLEGDKLEYELRRSRSDAGNESAVTHTGVLQAEGAARQGSYKVTYTGADLIIEKASAADLGLSVTGGYEDVYDGQTHQLKVTVAPAYSQQGVPDQAEVAYRTSRDGRSWSVWSAEAPSFTDITNGTVYVQVRAHNANYEDAFGGYGYGEAGSFTINKRPVRVSADNLEKVYMRSDPELTAVVEGTVDGHPLAYTIARPDKGARPGEGAGEAVGEHSIVITLGNNPNYDVSVTNGILTIKPAPAAEIGLLVGDYAAPYDGKAHGVEILSRSKLPEGTTLTYSLDGKNFSYSDENPPTFTNVSDTQADPKRGVCVWVRASNPNYETAEATAWVQIQPRAVTVAAKDASKVYGQKDPEFELTISNMDLPELEKDRKAILEATSVTRPDADTKQDVNLDADGKVIAYTDAIKVVGSPTYGTEGNYTITYAGADFTITPKPMPFELRGETATYDGTAHKVVEPKGGEGYLPEGVTFTYEYRDENHEEWTPTGNDGKDVPSRVDAGTMQVRVTASYKNYKTTSSTAVIEIKKRPIAVTARDQVIKYGDDIPTPVANVSGLVNGETIVPTLKTTAKPGSPCGTYAIEVSVDQDGGKNAAARNYDLKIQNGTLTIQKAPAARMGLASAVTAYEGVYDAGGHSVTVDASKLPKDTKLTYEFSTDGGKTWTSSGDAAESRTDVGTTQMRITATNDNYETATAIKNITVTPKEVDVTVVGPRESLPGSVSLSKTYGDEDPDLTHNLLFTGLLGKDVPSGVGITREQGEDAGTYRIMPGLNGASDGKPVVQGNYQLNFHPSTFTINRASASELGLKIHSFVGTYDGVEHGLTAELRPSERFKDESDPARTKIEYSLDGKNWSETSPVREDTTRLLDGGHLVVYVRAVNKNFYQPLVPDHGTITVEPKHVIIVADDKWVRVGSDASAIPALTWRAGDRENSDLIEKDRPNKGNLLVKLSKPNDIDLSQKGTYAITPSGEEYQGNYQLSFVKGILHVTEDSKRTPSLTPLHYDGIYDGKSHEALATVEVEKDLPDDMEAEVEYSLDGKADGEWKSDPYSFRDVTHAEGDVPGKLTRQVVYARARFKYKDESATHADSDFSTEKYSYAQIYVTIDYAPASVVVRPSQKEYGTGDPDQKALDALGSVVVSEGEGLAEEAANSVKFSVKRLPDRKTAPDQDAAADTTGEARGTYTLQAVNLQGSSQEDYQGNFRVSYGSADFTITKGSASRLGLNATSVTETYDGTGHVLLAGKLKIEEGTSLSYAWRKPGEEDWQPLDKEPSLKDVGTYQVRITASNPNYDSALVGEDGYLTLTVNRREMTVRATGNEKVFGFDDPETFSSSVTGMVAGEDAASLISYTVERTDKDDPTGENAGVHHGVLMPTGNADQGNYHLVFVGGDFVINRGTMSLELTGFTGVYDGQEHQIGRKLSARGKDGSTIAMEDAEATSYEYKCFRDDAEIKWEIGADGRPLFRDVTDGPVTVRVTAHNSNYVDATAKAVFNITRRPVTVTPVTGLTKVFDTEDPTIGGAVSTDALDTEAMKEEKAQILQRSRFERMRDKTVDSYGITAGENVGSYAITGYMVDDAGNRLDAEGVRTAFKNYEITYAPGSFQITKAPMAISEQGYSGVYDGEEHQVAATVSTDTNAEHRVKGQTTLEYSLDDGKTWSAEEPTIKHAGTKTVLVRATNKNYEAPNTTMTLVVTKRTVTVHIDDQTKVYGDPDPELTFSIKAKSSTGGPVDDLDRQGIEDAVKQGITRKGASERSGRNVGTYDINGGSKATGYLANDYTINFENDGKLVITKRKVTIKANDVNKEYGVPDPTFTGTVYELDENGELVKYSPDPQNTYGSDCEALLANTKFAREEGRTVGKYPILVSERSADDSHNKLPNSNYEVTYENGTLTNGYLEILQAEGSNLTLTAEGINCTYDGDTHYLKVSANPKFFEDKADLSYQIVGVDREDFWRAWGERGPGYINATIAGDISVRVRAQNSNYKDAFVEVTVHIGRLKVTLAATGLSKQYGLDDPTLKPSLDKAMSGSHQGNARVQGEKQAIYDMTSYSRVKGENVGTYTISPDVTASQKAYTNYDISTQTALLTIDYAPAEDLRLKADNLTVYYDANPHAASDVVSASPLYSKATGTQDVATFEYTLTPNDENSWTTDVSAFTYTDATIGELNEDGTYPEKPITVWVRAKNPNYNTTEAKQINILIRQRPVTVTPDDVTKVWGEGDPQAYTGKVVADRIEGQDPYVLSPEAQGTLLGNVTYARELAGKAEGELVTKLSAAETANYPYETRDPYVINASQTDSAINKNYKVSYGRGLFNIRPRDARELGFSANGGEVVYDGQRHYLTTYGFDTVDMKDKAAVEYWSEKDKAWVSDQPFWCDAMDASEQVRMRARREHYFCQEETVSVQVKPRPVTVAIKPATKVYGNPDPDYEWYVQDKESSPSGYGLVSETDDDGWTAPTYTREKGESIGDYEVTLTGLARQGNYAITYAPGTLEIQKASLNNDDPTNGRYRIDNLPDITKGVTYNGRTQELVPRIFDKTRNAFMENGKDFDLSYVVKSKTDDSVIDSNDHCNVTPDDCYIEIRITGKNNYKEQYPEGRVVYRILPAHLVAFAENATRSYDGSPLTAGARVEGLQNGETVTVVTEGSQTNVGSSQNLVKSLSFNGTAKASNYTYDEGENVAGTLTVTPADIADADRFVVTFDKSDDLVYTGGEHKLTPRVHDKKTNKDLRPDEFSVSYGDTVNAGEVTVTIKGTDSEAKRQSYTGTRNASYTIKRAPLVVYTPGASKTYDGTALTRGDGARVEGLQNGESVQLLVTGSATTVAQSGAKNTYRIVWKDSAGDLASQQTALSTNYEILPADEHLGVLTILPRANADLGLDADDIRQVYDGQTHTVTGKLAPKGIDNAVVDTVKGDTKIDYRWYDPVAKKWSDWEDLSRSSHKDFVNVQLDAKGEHAQVKFQLRASNPNFVAPVDANVIERIVDITPRQVKIDLVRGDAGFGKVYGQDDPDFAVTVERSATGSDTGAVSDQDENELLEKTQVVRSGVGTREGENVGTYKLAVAAKPGASITNYQVMYDKDTFTITQAPASSMGLLATELTSVYEGRDQYLPAATVADLARKGSKPTVIEYSLTGEEGSWSTELPHQLNATVDDQGQLAPITVYVRARNDNFQGDATTRTRMSIERRRVVVEPDDNQGKPYGTRPDPEPITGHAQMAKRDQSGALLGTEGAVSAEDAQALLENTVFERVPGEDAREGGYPISATLANPLPNPDVERNYLVERKAGTYYVRDANVGDEERFAVEMPIDAVYSGER